MDKHTELLENLLVTQVLNLAHAIRTSEIAAGYNPTIETSVKDAIDLMDDSRKHILQKLGVSR